MMSGTVETVMPLIYSMSVHDVNRTSEWGDVDLVDVDGSNERLRKAREAAGFPSARKAALRYGWNVSTYGSHENGQTPVPPKAATEYARAFRCSAGWILTGEGPAPEQRPRKPLSELRQRPLVDSFDPTADDGDRPAPPFPDAIPQAAAVMGGGSLGAPFFQVDTSSGEAFTVDAVRDWWRIPPDVLQRDSRTNPRHVAIFPMAGDSMEPTILRTDHVVVDTSRRRLEPDGIWAIDYGLGVTLKRLILRRTRGGDRVIIKSDNPNYPDEEYAPDELTIVGRYVGRFTVY